MSGILDSYRVLDLSDERGLLCGRILADLGADVVQVEPPGGSSARAQGPFCAKLGVEGSLFWWAYARGKRSITLDLESASGRDRLRDLVRTADFLIESGTPGAMSALGLGYPELAALNPGLVYVSISPYGQSGPKSTWAATDLTIGAASGVIQLYGDDDRPPVRMSAPQAFLHASADAAVAALAAHHERSRSGLGQHVDVSAQMSMALASQFNNLAAAWQSMEPSRCSGGFKIGPLKLQWHYPAADGWVHVTVLTGSALGPFLAKLMKVVHEEGFCDEATRDKDWIGLGEQLMTGGETLDELARIVGVISDCTRSKTKAEWLKLTVERGLLVVPVSTAEDLLEQAHFAERRYFRALTHDGVDREILYPGPFVGFSRSPIVYGRAAPKLAEHQREVAAELVEAKRSQRVHCVEPRPTSRPLEDVKILDFTWVMAGPAATRILADLGADVIRIESPTHVDAARTVGPVPKGDRHPDGAGLYVNVNAGKRNVTLDLSKPEAREVALALVGWADVVVESFSPGTIGALGLAYEDLRAGKPDIIMLSSCLFGQTGPLAQVAGYGTMGGAVAGFSELVGWSDRPPAGVTGAYTDYVAPRFTVCAILAALEHRRRTGEGQYIDQSQIESATHFLTPEILRWQIERSPARRFGTSDPDMAPHGVYPTAGEDRWIAIACQSDTAWSGICAALGRKDWAADSSLGSVAGRRARIDEIDAAIAAWTATRRGDDADRLLQAHGVAAQSLHTSAEYLADPQVLHSGYLTEVQVGTVGKLPIEGPRFRMSRSRVEVRGGAASLGQHTNEVLREIVGYDDEAITRLVLAGALG